MIRGKRGFRHYEALKLNFYPIILFELFYKAFGTYCFFPFLVFMVRRVLMLRTDNIIALDTIKRAFATPFNVLALLILGMLASYYFLLEISVLMEGFRFSGNGWRTGAFTLFAIGFKKSLNYFYPRNWLAFILVFAYFPFLHFGLKSGIANGLYILNLTELYTGMVVTRTITVVAFFVMIFISCLFCYAFVLFSIKRSSFTQDCIESIEFYKTDFRIKVYGIFRVLLTVLLFTLLGFAVLLLGMLLVYAVVFTGGQPATTEVYRRFVDLASPLLSLFFLYCSVTGTTFFFSGVYGLVLTFYPKSEKVRRKKTSYRPVLAILVLFLAIGYSVFQGGEVSKGISDDSLIIAQTGGLLTGHRGNIKEEIQNTAASFESAIRNGAEYIELDVRRSSDGVLVVAHDEYVLNGYGDKLYIADTPYSELQSIYIPGVPDMDPIALMTLDEAIDLCGDRVRLNIELKTIRNDEGFVQNVIDVVKKHGIQSTCFLASSNYGYVKGIEDIDESIQTLFLTDSNYGDIENLDADGLSLAFNAIDQPTIDRIHLKGKMVHAWILESENDFKVMIGFGVDYLITNDVRMAQVALANNRPSHERTVRKVIEYMIVQS